MVVSTRVAIRCSVTPPPRLTQADQVPSARGVQATTRQLRHAKDTVLLQATLARQLQADLFQ